MRRCLLRSRRPGADLSLTSDDFARTLNAVPPSAGRGHDRHRRRAHQARCGVSTLLTISPAGIGDRITADATAHGPGHPITVTIPF